MTATQTQYKVVSRDEWRKAHLEHLAEGKRQLIVYHCMFDTAWEEWCKSCSFVADSFAGSLVHLAARDTSFAVIARAPVAKIESFKKRMGWNFPWLSSFGGGYAGEGA